MTTRKDEKKHRKPLLDSAETRILSDILAAELSGTPLVWQRYRAEAPRRIPTIDRLFQRQMIELPDGANVTVTLRGFVALNTRVAKRLSAVLEGAFKVMREHYRAHFFNPLLLRTVASRAGVDLDDLVVVTRILQRGGPTLMAAGQPPVTTESSLTGSENLVTRPSFRSYVQEIRLQLANPWQPLAPSSAFAFGGMAGGDLYSPGLTQFAGPDAKAAWRKCLERVESDPDGAITSARSFLETVCKQVLDAQAIPHAPAASLTDLYGAVMKVIDLDPGALAPASTRKILSGCFNVVAGVAELRNALGDSHGKTPGTRKPGQRHSKLAVAVAGAAATFLLNTDEARRGP